MAGREVTQQRAAVTPVVAQGAPAPYGHYSPATLTGDGCIWTSAQLPAAHGIGSDSDIRDQARQALAHVISVVEAAGGAATSVVKVTLYLTDIEDWDEVDAVFGEAFGTHRPARTVVQVASLHHGYRVAADAVAWRMGAS